MEDTLPLKETIERLSSKIKDSLQLSLRLDQPIVGCELIPYIYTSSTSSISFSFHWYRSTKYHGCSNPYCERLEDRSVPLLKATIECLICHDLKNNHKISSFCTIQCFHQYWKEHQELYHQEENTKQLWKLCMEKYKEEKGYRNLLEETEKEEIVHWKDLHHIEKEYIPKEEDIGYMIRLHCHVKKKNEIITSEIIDTKIVLPFAPRPKPRTLIQQSCKKQTQRSLRVMSYNILAEIYATRQIYPYCPSWALNWEYRRRLILEEILKYNPDILCFQEVQADHFDNFFTPNLQAHGYKGIYDSKTRECMGALGKIDGCAIFYKEKRYVLTYRKVINFNEEALKSIEQNEGNISKASKYSRRLHRLMKDNIAQTIVLRDQQLNMDYLIANTHIFSQAECPDVKLWQIHILLQEVSRVLQSKNYPLILCGDFNSTPESAVYEYLSTGYVSPLHPELLVDPVDILSSLSLSHALSLSSAYATLLGNVEVSYTNYTGRWTGTVDYIWYNREFLTPFQVYEIPSINTLTEYTQTPLPNCQYPSDHISICADFQVMNE